jgi:tRNA-guanine family transglycosylase
MFEPILSDENSRIGILSTRNGSIETPTIFPVHDLGPKGGYNTPEYWKVFPEINTGMFNASLIIHCSKDKREKILREGIEGYCNFSGHKFLDSGGYTYNKYNLSYTQEEILRIQEGLKSDIASTLDYPILMNKKYNNIDIIKSIENSKKALKLRKDEEMLLYTSIHGYDPVIIKNCIRHLRKFGEFDGYAIGSLMKHYPNYRLLIDMIITVKKEIGNKPLHVYGLSGSVVIPLLVYLGVDSVDSSSYILAAGNKGYFIPSFRRREIKFIEEEFSEICNCKICQGYTKEEITNSRPLLSYHNVWVLWKQVQKIKRMIKESSLEKYLAKRLSINPWGKVAFKYAKRKTNFGIKGGF